jgi:hypothetical protein
MAIIPSRFIWNISFIAGLILCLLPLELEVCLSNLGRLNELHIVNVDSLSDQVGLLKTSLVVVVDETVDRAKLRIIEPEMGPQENSLRWPQVDTLCFL